MNILIVEDEALYASHLEILIEDLGHTVGGCVDNAPAALQMVSNSPPDLVLMDINIAGDYDGVETAELIQKAHPCPVIFITARQDEQTFRRASRIGPANFLLKPFDELQVKRAIQLAVASVSTNATGRDARPADGSIGNTMEGQSLYVKSGDKLRKIDIGDITSASADGRYCEIHTAAGRYLMRITFRELMDRLPADQFLKTHRGHLVNEGYIDSVDLRDSEIVLRGGRRIPLAKREREEFLRRVSK
ncbi:LytTR family DNA-binding domain-containing protein [Lewinella sp. 4G2]|uniref:LytR/AlgR family response regulator transcription factor n=1 Tax=Lewinella sp. 4G2 TaxID=1803372 RepID=UPI0007B4E8D3|nr:response regulator [Lewinella sp. 4G2]OAV44708.1 hypothetical protein A3850_009485 [Lewinella sp. 4G2]